MIENMEESILGSSFSCQLVNIIQNQHVYQLIKVQEIIDLVLTHSFSELRLEHVRCQVQHHFIRVILLDFHPDSLS